MDKNSLKEIIEECSNKNVKVVNTGGTSALGLLGVVLIALKLTGYISISWWWVLAPFWIPFAFAIALVLLIIITAIIFSFFSKNDDVENVIAEKENTTVVNNGIIITPNADVKNTTKSSKKKSSKKNVNNESGNAKNTDKRI